MKIIKGPGYVGNSSQFRIGPQMGQELVRKSQEYVSTGNASKLIGPNMEAIIADIQSNGFFFAVPKQLIAEAQPNYSAGGPYFSYYASSGPGVRVSLEVENTTWNNPSGTVEYKYNTNTAGAPYEIELWNTHKGMWLWPGVAYKFTLDPESGRFIPIDLPMQPVVTARVVDQNIPFGSPTPGQAEVFYDGVPVAGKFIPIHHTWVKFGEEIEVGADVFVQWFPERGSATKGEWLVIGAPDENSSDIVVAEITESPGISNCALVNRSNQCLYQAKKVFNNPPAFPNQCGDEQWTDGDEIYLVDITGCEPVTQLKKGDRYLAKRLGLITINNQDRELYGIRGDKSSSSVGVIRISTESQGYDDCQTVQTNDGCVYDGILLSNNLGGQCDTPWVDGTPVWAINVASCSQPANVKKADRFVAVNLGQLTITNQTRPLYAFRHVDGGDQTKIVTVLPYASQPLACQTIDPAAPACILSGRISTALAFGDPDEFGNECNVQNWTNDDEIWIINLATCGSKVQIPFGERFIGQYVMDYEHDGSTKPLYAIYYRPSSAGSSAIVAVSVVGPQECHSITPNNSCVYPGVLIFNGDDEPDVCQTDNFVEGSEIWIVDVNNCNNAGAIPNNERFVAHRLGMHTHGGTTLPLYGVRYNHPFPAVASVFHELLPVAQAGAYDTIDFQGGVSQVGATGLSTIGTQLINTSGGLRQYMVVLSFHVTHDNACASCEFGLNNAGISPINYELSDSGCAGGARSQSLHGAICGIITVANGDAVEAYHGLLSYDGVLTPPIYFRVTGTLTRLS